MTHGHRWPRGRFSRMLVAALLGVATLAGVSHGNVRPALAGSTSLASNPVAISITAEGVYRLSYAYLTSQNIDLSQVDATKLGLSDNGVAVPFYASPTGSTFGSNDFIEFYGHPVNTTYTSTNVYILSDDGTNHDPVTPVSVASPSAPASTAQATYHDLQRSLRWANDPFATAYTTDTSWPSAGDSHWFESNMEVYAGNGGTTATSTFTLSSVDPSSVGPCALTLTAVGAPFRSSSSNPSHNLGISINNNTAPSPWPTGSAYTLQPSYAWTSPSSTVPAAITVSGTFPCSWLNASGTNQITFSTQPNSATPVEDVDVQNFAVTYGENLCATGDSLSWQGPTGGGPYGGAYTVSGFSSAPIDVWRVSLDPSSGDYTGATMLTGFSPPQNTGGAGPCSSGTYSISLDDTGAGASPSGPVVYFAAAPTASDALQPASVRPLDETDLTSSAATSAQYVIITNPVFEGSDLNNLASYEQSRGLTTTITSLTSIYDQFGHGLVDPDAIRAYISQYAQQYYASHAANSLYVLLVGGDTYDYHNFFNCPSSGLCAGSNPSNQSLLPSLYVNSPDSTSTARTYPSDMLYAVPAGASSNTPDVAIGRLPVLSAAQLHTEVTKIVNWATEAGSEGGLTTFAAGDNKAGGPDFDFQTASNTMIAALPAGFSASTHYEDGNHSDELANRSAFLSAFNSGMEIVNFMGHGDAQQWSVLPLFASSDVANLTNANKPSIVLQWGCQTSDITEPRLSNVSQTLLNATDSGAPSGAVLTLGSTGQDYASQQAVLADGMDPAAGLTDLPSGGFYGYLTRGYSVGLALTLAKRDIMHNSSMNNDPSYIDVVNSYTILGDPATTLIGTPATQLHPGWNLIGVAPSPGSPTFQASAVAASIDNSLGPDAVSLVAGYGPSGYSVYSASGGSGDFTATPTQGLFVLMTTGGLWSQSGYVSIPARTYTLSAGWNLMALPLPPTPTAAGLQQAIDGASSTGNTKAVATYAQGSFQLYVPGYSADHSLNPQGGVFVLLRSAANWTH